MSALWIIFLSQNSGTDFTIMYFIGSLNVTENKNFKKPSIQRIARTRTKVLAKVL
jgi:hypothetical protein